MPLQTLRADIDYGLAEANTTFGIIGVKVWIYHGDVLPERQGERVSSQGPCSAQPPTMRGERGDRRGAPATDAATGVVIAMVDAASSVARAVVVRSGGPVARVGDWWPRLAALVAPVLGVRWPAFRAAGAGAAPRAPTRATPAAGGPRPESEAPTASHQRIVCVGAANERRRAGAAERASD